MVVKTLPENRPSLLDTEPSVGDLVLRVCNGSRSGQIVRLKSAKCTIGSGPYCTLRLRACGVSPLHCLIVRGRVSTVVRRWTADTRLNFQSFTDAPLSTGDQLSIGPVELEVMSLGAKPIPIEASGATQPIDSKSETEAQLEELAASLDKRQTLLSTQAEHLDVQLADLQTQRQQWQTEQAETQRQIDEQQEQFSVRLAELETEKQALAEVHPQLEAQRDEATRQAAAHEEQLNARLAETESARKTLEQQQQQWQVEQSDAQRQLDTQRDELHARQAELEAQQNTLVEEQRLREVQQNEATSQTAISEEQLHARQAELETQQNALAEERQLWEVQQNEATSQTSISEEQLHAQQAELEAQQNALAEERRLWEVQRDESTRLAEQNATVEPTVESATSEPEFQSPSEGAPVDLADVFHRVGTQVEQEEEESSPHASTPPSDEPPGSDVSRSPIAASSSPAKEEGEESIDDYMNRLMQRLNSGGEPESASNKPSSSTPSQTEPTVEPSQPQTVDAQTPETIAPRAVAPETHSDLSAFRELANLSAQSAIGRYSNKVLIRTMHSKLIVALVGLTAGGTLLWMWNSLGVTQMAVYSAMLALLVAIYWGVEYAVLTGRLNISKSGHIDVNWRALPFGRKTPSSNKDSVAKKDTDATGLAEDVDSHDPS